MPEDKLTEFDIELHKVVSTAMGFMADKLSEQELKEAKSNFQVWITSNFIAKEELKKALDNFSITTPFKEDEKRVRVVEEVYEVFLKPALLSHFKIDEV